MFAMGTSLSSEDTVVNSKARALGHSILGVNAISASATG